MGSVQFARHIPAVNMAVQLVRCLPAALTAPLPAVDSPFLAIKIDRDQGGVKYGFDSAVSKQAQNLIVSGPPAEDIGFLGSSTYAQEAYPHVPPFLAFTKNYATN